MYKEKNEDEEESLHVSRRLVQIQLQIFKIQPLMLFLSYSPQRMVVMELGLKVPKTITQKSN